MNNYKDTLLAGNLFFSPLPPLHLGNTHINSDNFPVLVDVTQLQPLWNRF